MTAYVKFLIVWATNLGIIFLANSYYSDSFVLGNAVMTPTMAGILTGFFLTLFARFSKTFSGKFLGNKFKMFGYYFLVNSVGIWLLARLSVITGFGIPSFYWAFYLGFITVIAQWLVRQGFKKFKFN